MSYDVIPRLLRSRSSRSVAVFAKDLPLSVCYHVKRTAGKWYRCGKKIKSIVILQVTKTLLATFYCSASPLTFPRHNGPEVKLSHARVDKNDDSRLMLLSFVLRRSFDLDKLHATPSCLVYCPSAFLYVVRN